MILIICMAGKNTRFHDVGVDVPKYLLPVNGKPIIEVIIRNLLQAGIFSDVFLIAHLRDKSFRGDLEKSMSALNLQSNNIIYIGETGGQAETAYLGLEICLRNEDKPVVFHNADTILLGRGFDSLRKQLNNGIGSVDVFNSRNEQYSYVELNLGKISRIEEKILISDIATSGLYGFPSSNAYKKIFEQLFNARKDNAKKEIYISDIISAMIEQGVEFEVNDESYKSKSTETTLVLGTPLEYNVIVSSKVLKI
jgi:dTDP-glucose pyrophosphorylase